MPVTRHGRQPRSNVGEATSPNPHIGERTKLTTRQERIDDFIHEGSPPNDQPLQILCEELVGPRRPNPAVDTFVRMNDQHILALIETIDGADFHTIHQFAFDATLIDYIGHGTTLLNRQAVSVVPPRPSHIAPSGLPVRTKGSRC
jgi:hypothetical protein